MKKPLTVILAIIAACTALCAPAWPRSSIDEKVPAWTEPPGVRQELSDVSEYDLASGVYDNEQLSRRIPAETFTPLESDEVSSEEKIVPEIEMPQADH